MADVISYANSIIDTEQAHGPVNRVSNELTEISSDLAVVESFSHVWIARTADGIVLFDASGPNTAPAVLTALRSWTSDEVHTVVYTHGHMDHVGGAAAIVADAEARGHRRPCFVGHANVAPRLDRYRRTNGYNLAINARQFAPGRKRGLGISGPRTFVPDGTPDPDVTFTDDLTLEVGGEQFLLHHDRGETDDHAWTEWVGRKTLFVGDFVIWNFPNCGNPQKVLRYPVQWAAALRKMIATGPELVGPAHGLPMSGSVRAERVLSTMADALEFLVREVLDMLNADARLSDAIHDIQVPAELLALPWLRPFYDEPEFVVRNIWRTFGGWWDGNPAHLHPAREQVLAHELVDLAGASALIARALTVAADGDLRTAAELIEFVTKALPNDTAAHEARSEIYARKRIHATSLMAKGIYEEASRLSAAQAGIDPPTFEYTRPLA